MAEKHTIQLTVIICIPQKTTTKSDARRTCVEARNWSPSSESLADTVGAVGPGP